MAAEETVGHGIHSFLWSEQEYEPRDLFERFGHLLPFVAMVTQGYCGKDEPIHMFASDEMYWLRDVAFQKRVVCQDNNKDYYSIPMCYPGKVTPSHSNGIDGPQMSIEEMVSDGSYRFFSFEPGCCHAITKNADNFQYKDLGTLEISETYDERFLIVHTLLSEAYDEPPTDQNPEGFYNTAGVLSNCTVIPLYMPIALAVALGMSDTETENFRRTMYNFRKFVDKLPKDYDEILKGISDIMAFDEKPSGGDYEYIHFLQFIRANKEMKNISSDGYWTISDVSTISPKPELPRRSPNAAGSESGSAPKRPPKPGENKKIAVLNKLFKKSVKTKIPTKSLPNPKERAPSPTSDSDDESFDDSFDDSFECEEVVNSEHASYEKPVPPSTTLVPTPIAYREGPVALGIDANAILTELNHMFSNGIIPKSTKLAVARKKNVRKVDDVARVQVTPVKNTCKQTDMEQLTKPQCGALQPVSDSHTDGDQPPRPHRVPVRSASTSHDDNNHHVEMSSHQVKSHSLDRNDFPQKPNVQKRSMPHAPRGQSFRVSDILSSKQSLKRAGYSTGYSPRRDGHTDDRSQPSNPEQFANANHSEKSFASGLRHKQAGILIKKPRPKTSEDKNPKESTMRYPSSNDELGSILEQQRQRINTKPVVDKSAAVVRKETKRVAVDEQLQLLLEQRRMKNEIQDSKTETSTTKVKFVQNPKDNSPADDRKEIGFKTHGQEISGTVQGKARHIPVHGSNVAVDQPKLKQKPTLELPSTKAQVSVQPFNKSEKVQPTEFSDVKKSKFVLKVLSDDIVSGADIPQDVSNFTVGDVARCLELLNMSDYVDEFVAQQIDGALLQHIDENTLQTEFGINSLMATKLVLFAKDGWHPNV